MHSRASSLPQGDCQGMAQAFQSAWDLWKWQGMAQAFQSAWDLWKWQGMAKAFQSAWDLWKWQGMAQVCQSAWGLWEWQSMAIHVSQRAACGSELAHEDWLSGAGNVAFAPTYSRASSLPQGDWQGMAQHFSKLGICRSGKACSYTSVSLGPVGVARHAHTLQSAWDL